MKEYTLKVAQNDFAAGTAFRIEKASKAHASVVEDRVVEIARFYGAVSSLDRQLAAAATKAGGQSSKIFEAERVMLKDWEFIDAIQDQIKSKGMDAESAIEATGRNLAEAIRNSGNEYISERAEEVMGLTDRLISLLEGKQGLAPDAPSIIVANELTPVQLSITDPSLILGIVTANGAPTSHVSIIAGNMGIPYVYGSEEAVKSVCAGTKLIVDGEKLIVDPDEDAYRIAVQAMEEAKEAKRRETESTQRAASRTKAETRANDSSAEKVQFKVSPTDSMVETHMEADSFAAPADGKLVPMENIPDPAFSSGVLGECVGILPESGNIYAPCNGTVSGIAETKHAITFITPDDKKILLHAGIDTVTLGGKGFEVLVEEGDPVAKGDLVLKMDLDVIRKAGLSPMVITSRSF